MAEHARVESQKIMFHHDWMAAWQKGRLDWRQAKSIYPIQIELSVSGACNHRCAFCAMDFVGYKPKFLSRDLMAGVLKDMAKGGVKSVMFGGEGEPCLNPALPEIINTAKKLGLDTALTTNGALMGKDFLESCLKNICWIKVSIDAAKKETHEMLHRPKNPGDWEKIFANLAFATKLKKVKNYNCRIGAQLTLLPETRDENGKTIPGNAGEAVMLAWKLKKIGLDYFIIKPYSHQPLSITKIYEDVSYKKDLSGLEKALQKISAKNFEIIFRSNTMNKYSAPRGYKHCLAIPFAWAYIMADGSVWSCSVYLGDKRFYLGNIKEKTFKEVWEGGGRKKQWEFMQRFEATNCRKNCIMDRVNEFLWEATHRPYNINYI